MARNRMIRPEFWEDAKMAKLTPMARLLYIALWNFADDEGYLQYDVDWIRIKCFPYESNTDVSALLNELFELKRIDKNNGVIKIQNFLKYQRVEKPKKSDLKKQFGEVSGKSSGEVGEQSQNDINSGSSRGVVAPEVKLSEVKRSEEKRSEVNARAREESEKELGAAPTKPPFYKILENQNGITAETTAKRLFEGLEVSDDATTAQQEAIDFLTTLGFVCEKEVYVEDRGEGHGGRIDIVAKYEDKILAIEIDNITAREKSVYKLKSFNADKKVILLRAGEYDLFEDIEIIPICKKNKNHAARERTMSWDEQSRYAQRVGISKGVAEQVIAIAKGQSIFLTTCHWDAFKGKEMDEIIALLDSVIQIKAKQRRTPGLRSIGAT